MKHYEVKEQIARITKYREIEKVRDEIQAALDQVTKPWENGPHGQGPFTGNTRESRRVESMLIKFSPTRGGAPAVDCHIVEMHIDAWELGRALEAILRAKIDVYNAELEKI